MAGMTAPAEVIRFVQVIDDDDEGGRPTSEKTGCPLWKHDNGMVSGISRSGNSTCGGYAGHIRPNWVRCLG